eukprot:SAG31_NODE_4657_length_3064_cov_1.947049_4_plen_46_part_01
MGIQPRFTRFLVGSKIFEMAKTDTKCLEISEEVFADLKERRPKLWQ